MIQKLSYLEAIEELKIVYSLCKNEPLMQEAINTVIMHSIRYAWHDLREDPTDLPKPLDNSIMYDCVLENHIYDASYPSFYFDDYTKQFGVWNSRYSIANGANEFITVDELGYEKVIAWREIEPYEEVKDNDY